MMGTYYPSGRIARETRPRVIGIAGRTEHRPSSKLECILLNFKVKNREIGATKGGENEKEKRRKRKGKAKIESSYRISSFNTDPQH